MNEEQSKLLDDLRQKGVPEPLVEQLEFLVLEVEGYLVADGWAADPAGQAQFVAEQLIRQASRFMDIRREILEMADE